MNSLNRAVRAAHGSADRRRLRVGGSGGRCRVGGTCVGV